jgi:hypothetical protein
MPPSPARPTAFSSATWEEAPGLPDGREANWLTLRQLDVSAHDRNQLVEALWAATGFVLGEVFPLIASHMEAVNHCLLPWAELRAFSEKTGMTDRLLVPEDDEAHAF